MVRRTASSISGVTPPSSAGPTSCRSQARWPYRRRHVVTASCRSCSWTPRWWVPVQASGSERPSSACQSSGGMSSSTTAMPTWLTGALVSARIARSAIEAPRKTHTSPVRVSSTALSSASSATGDRLRSVRPWKLLGLAGLAGVAATGAVLARNERQRRAYTPDDVRSPAARARTPHWPRRPSRRRPAELTAGRMHRLARLLRRR